jgi:tetratricopeptide (TPR) repeat protein
MEPAPAAQGTAAYPNLLAAGDEHRAAGKFSLALTDYATALTQAANDTEQALAMAKEGMIYVYDQTNYAAARHTVDAALQLNNVQPVALVTVLEVQAECQIHVDKDIVAAAETIEKALKLRGVDWSRPHLSLKLGDCYRSTGRFADAVAMYQKVTQMPQAIPAIKASSYLNMGQAYQYNLQDSEKAKAAYADAVQLKPRLKSQIDGYLAEIH